MLDYGEALVVEAAPESLVIGASRHMAGIRAEEVRGHVEIVEVPSDARIGLDRATGIVAKAAEADAQKLRHACIGVTQGGIEVALASVAVIVSDGLIGDMVRQCPLQR